MAAKKVRILAVAALLVCGCFLLPACKKKKDSADIVFVPVAAHTDCVKVFDPKLDGSPAAQITYAVEPPGYTYDVTVSIMDGGSPVRVLVDAVPQSGGYDYTTTWDGKNGSGEYVDPKAYDVVVDAIHSTVTPTTCQAEINVVRLGADGMSFGGFPLVYPKRGPANTTDFAITAPQWALENLDTATGTSRAEAVPNASAMYPDSFGAATCNYPFCYASGSQVQFDADMGSQAISNITQTSVGVGYPVTGLPIRVEASGFSPDPAGSNEDISPGGQYAFTADAALPGGCAVDTLTIDLTFSYQDGAVWVPIPGMQRTTHKLYRVMDDPIWVDYDGDLSVDSFVYAPLAEWSCTWAAGCAADVKQVADACYFRLAECDLQYGGIMEWWTAGMLDGGGGMCDGWNDIFDHLVTVQGMATSKYGYLLWDFGAAETKWASIIIKAPGMNRTVPAMVPSNDFYCVDSVYPYPSLSDVTFYYSETWYLFGSPSQRDGHCINLLDYGGVIYLYDPSFRNTLGPTPFAGVFASLPAEGFLQGSGLAAYKSIYHNVAVDYHRGYIYCDHDDNPGTPHQIVIVDIRTSLFGADELRLYWSPN